MSEHEVKESPLVPRRTVLKAAAVGAVATASGRSWRRAASRHPARAHLPALVRPPLRACTSTAASVVPSAAEAIPFKIGFVSPQTGPVAGFGEPDPYIIGLVQAKLEPGFQAGGKNYAITIVQKDGKSDPAKAAQVANDLITSDKVDMILATSTPENNNPVADAAEAAGVPFISTVEPWEAFFFARQKDPAKPVPFKFTYIFCFGVAEFAKTYISMWDDIPTNKKVGVMWPNDADGNAIRAALGPQLTAAGYTIIDPAPTKTGRTTTPRRSPSSRPRTARSSTRSRSRQTSRRSGSRRRSRATSRRSPRSPRPGCSRRRSRRSASSVSAWRARPTGRRRSRTPRRCSARRRLTSRAAIPRARAAMEPGPGHHDRAVRRRDQRHRRRDRPEGQGRPRGRDRQAQHHLDGRQDRLHVRAVPERLAGSDHRRPVDQGSHRKVQGRFRIVENATDPNVPIAGKLTPYRAWTLRPS